MPRETAGLSGWRVGKALAYAAERGWSTVVEGTLRHPETTPATMEQLARAGAATHPVALGVPPLSSWTGCINRYLTAPLPTLERNGTTRYDNVRGPDGSWTRPEHAAAVPQRTTGRTTNAPPPDVSAPARP